LLGYVPDTFDSLTEALTLYLPVIEGDDGPDIGDVQTSSNGNLGCKKCQPQNDPMLMF